MQELTEEEQMPPTNKPGKARHSPDQQPSLLEQLEFEEEPGYEDDPHREDSAKEAEEHHTREPAAEPAYSRPGPAEDPYDPALEPLEKAYTRYVEIINEKYDSSFSDAKRNAAFKEAAKDHAVKITDLKRYSTAVALGIPYHQNADSESETAPLDHETE